MPPLRSEGWSARCHSSIAHEVQCSLVWLGIPLHKEKSDRSCVHRLKEVPNLTEPHCSSSQFLDDREIYIITRREKKDDHRQVRESDNSSTPTRRYGMVLFLSIKRTPDAEIKIRSTRTLYRSFMYGVGQNTDLSASPTTSISDCPISAFPFYSTSFLFPPPHPTPPHPPPSFTGRRSLNGKLHVYMYKQ